MTFGKFDEQSSDLSEISRMVFDFEHIGHKYEMKNHDRFPIKLRIRFPISGHNLENSFQKNINTRL